MYEEMHSMHHFKYIFIWTMPFVVFDNAWSSAVLKLSVIRSICASVYCEHSLAFITFYTWSKINIPDVLRQKEGGCTQSPQKRSDASDMCNDAQAEF